MTRIEDEVKWKVRIDNMMTHGNELKLNWKWKWYECEYDNAMEMKLIELELKWNVIVI